MRSPTRRHFLGSITGIVTIHLTGCQPSVKSSKCPVTGTVYWREKILPKAVVTMIPDQETSGQGGMGLTDGNGAFVIHGFDNQPGLVAGNYRVTVSKIVRSDGSDFPAGSQVGPMDADGREMLPAKYSDPVNTILTATVGPEAQPLTLRLSAE